MKELVEVSESPTKKENGNGKESLRSSRAKGLSGSGGGEERNSVILFPPTDIPLPKTRFFRALLGLLLIVAAVVDIFLCALKMFWERRWPGMKNAGSSR